MQLAWSSEMYDAWGNSGQYYTNSLPCTKWKKKFIKVGGWNYGKFSKGSLYLCL